MLDRAYERNDLLTDSWLFRSYARSFCSAVYLRNSRMQVTQP
jgi:hypothetical protein